jgi:uncharacterized repeat protein (TIGR03803 family)
MNARRASLFLISAALGLWVAPAIASKESVLYRFNGGKDGAAPYASMIADTHGSLFGTTSLGGGSANCASGCGTVFELSPHVDGSWSETVVHSFAGGSDGATPQVPMIFDAAGNLYGSTSEGGDGDCGNIGIAGCGTVFELSPPGKPGQAWTETVLYSFQGVPGGKGNGDAAWPNGLVFAANGDLYGLAYSGGHCRTDETGTDCYGAAFRLRQSSGGGWSEKVLYRFDGTTGSPASPVLDRAGNIYGTAPGGAYGFGAVFRLQASGPGPGWVESSIYDFRGAGDGAFPLPGLLFDATGNLYSASWGPTSGFNNVFEVTPKGHGTWSESVLYNFKNVARGYIPEVAPILGPDGNFYGMTVEGGGSDRGAVYTLSPPRPKGKFWQERVLHSFAGGSDGFAPYGGLNFGKGGALYGTTYVGGTTGCNGNGCGVVFKIKP